MTRGSSAIRVRREGDETKVSFFELFFDLVFVFAITQLSHRLLEHLTVGGALQTVLLLLGVWWAWMYTAWATNWFDPDHPIIRMTLIIAMFGALLMATAVPEAFEERGLWFAAGLAVVQVGRTLVIAGVSRGTPLGLTFQRILVWLMASSAFWLAGGFAGGRALVVLWLIALAIDFAAPWAGFAVPGLGRSTTADWVTLDGGHMAERCQLFIIIALGESVLVTGVTFGEHAHMDASVIAAFALTFLGSVAFWWIYFDVAAEAAAERIAHSDDPGRMGRSAYTYGHIPMVAGIIVTAVGDELVIAHPNGHTTGGTAAVIIGGAALFVFGHLLFKRAMFGVWSPQRLVALAALALLIPVSFFVSPLILTAAVVLILILLAVRDTVQSRATAPGPGDNEVDIS